MVPNQGAKLKGLPQFSAEQQGHPVQHPFM
jgi:hypothetical protein